MILWVFIKTFGVKIVITDILPIFTNIYRHFFRNSCTSARAPQSRFFGEKIGIFRFFGEKSVILPIFPDFSSDRFFLCFYFSVPAENRFFGDISVEKNDFLFPGLKTLL